MRTMYIKNYYCKELLVEKVYLTRINKFGFKESMVLPTLNIPKSLLRDGWKQYKN